MQSLVQQLADQGRGIVLISSELEDVIEGSTRVVVLKDGAVVGELDRDEIDEHRIMELMASHDRRPEPRQGPTSVTTTDRSRRPSGAPRSACAPTACMRHSGS